MTTWQFHWRLAFYRPWLYLLNCILWGLNAALPLGTGLAMKAFFDALSGEAPAGANIWTPIAIVAGIAITRMVAGMWGTWTFATFWQTIATLVTRNVVEWLTVAPGTRRLPDSPGEAVSRFRDDVREVLVYLDRWVDLTGVVVFITLGLVVMVSISPLVTLVVAVPLAATLLLTNRVATRLRIYRRMNREATGKVTDFVGEMFGAVQAVKVASAEPRTIRQFERLNDVRRVAALKDRLFSEVLRSVNANMANVAIGAVLLLAATRTGGERFTVGDFALFVSYLTRMAQWINFLGDVMAQHKRVGVSYDRLVGMLEGAPPSTLVEPAPVHLHGALPAVPVVARTAADRLERLALRGLTYRYPSTGRGVEGIDVTIERGTLTVVTGPIGAGKTTLLRALLGLLPRDSSGGGGEILWNGVPVEDPGSFFVPPRCAYTPQVPRLFSEALRDNVLLGQPDDALEQALRLAVMERDVASFPEGLDTIVGPRGVRLSGGQIQRTAAARMFARRPELLVFDDLSSALDLDTERQLWERLFGAGRRDVTCLVVSHREAVLRRADQIIVLADGRLESREPHEGSGWKQNKKIRASSPT